MGDATRILEAIDQGDKRAAADLLPLTELERVDPCGAKIVKLRFFGGLTHRQIAEALGVSLSTVERSWAFSRVWLFKRIRSGDAEG